MRLKRKKFPFFKQLDQRDCGPTCLKMITTFYGKQISREFLREKTHITAEGVSLMGLSEAAEIIGMQSLIMLSTYKMLSSDIPLPCIAHWRERHFIVIYKIDKKNIYIADPAFGHIKYSKDEFMKGWIPGFSQTNDNNQEGIILLLEPNTSFEKFENDIGKKTNFQFMVPFISPHHKLIIQLIIGLIIGSIIQLIFPFLTQSIVDIGINENNIKFINLVLIGQLVLFFAQITTNAIRSWLLLHITSRINISLLSSFFIKLMKLPISFFETKNIGDLMQRIQDNTRIQNFISSSSLNILFSAFNILVFGAVLFFYSWIIFSIFVLCAFANFFWVALFMKKRAALDYKRFDQASGNQSSTIQLLNGMQEIKLNNSEKRRRWEWELIQVRLFKLSTKSLSLSQVQDIGGGFILQLMGILITFIASKQVISGNFSLGTMLSIQYIIGQLNSPISGFIGFAQSYQDAKISLERMSEVYDKENEMDLNNNYIDILPTSKNITFRNVYFKYGPSSGPWVLKNINLTIPEGKVTAIVGGSGSGKTTLLKLILKIYEPKEGSISMSLINIGNFDSNFWRKKIGVVMQDGYLFADTIARNITESDSDGIIDKERLLFAVRTANLEEFVEALPNGYKTRVGSSGINISGGQKQRIFIARAIYKNADFLLFDEATSSLDANNEAIIMKNLESVYKTKTVIIVAHRLSTVKNADNIIVLDKGEIIEEGTHESLTKLKGAYYTLIKNQLELGK